MKYTSVFRQKIVRRTGFKYASAVTLLVMFLPIIILYRPKAENDIFWMINTGKHILSYGFMSVDPFTLHDGLNYSVQQWLTDVIFYRMYSIGGFFFVYLTVVLCYLYTTVMLYKLTMLLSEKNVTVSIATTIVCNILLGVFITARAQAFSYAIFVTEIYLLEKSIYSQDRRYLLGIPLLSILLINFNAVMWAFFFLLMVPYIIDGISARKTRVYNFLRQHARILLPMGYGTSLMAFVIAISLFCGYFNPYRLDNMIYVFKAYGNSNINNLIWEMQSPDFKTAGGMALFALYIFTIFTYLIVRGKTKLRYILITVGTAYLGVASVRNIPLFVICAVPFIAFYLKDAIPEKLIGLGKQEYEGRHKFITLILLVIAGYVFFNNNYVIDKQGEYAPTQAVRFIKSNLDLSRFRLFNEYETGGYLEYKGIRPFIDSRSEVFAKKLNGREDIISDYNGIFRGTLNYRKVFAKYDLNHALVSIDGFIDMQLKYDDEFEVVYRDDLFALYKLKDGEEAPAEEKLPVSE